MSTTIFFVLLVVSVVVGSNPCGVVTSHTVVNITKDILVSNSTCFHLAGDNILISGNGYAILCTSNDCVTAISGTSSNLEVRDITIIHFQKAVDLDSVNGLLFSNVQVYYKNATTTSIATNSSSLLLAKNTTTPSYDESTKFPSYTQRYTNSLHQFYYPTAVNTSLQLCGMNLKNVVNATVQNVLVSIEGGDMVVRGISVSGHNISFVNASLELLSANSISSIDVLSSKQVYFYNITVGPCKATKFTNYLGGLTFCDVEDVTLYDTTINSVGSELGAMEIFGVNCKHCIGFAMYNTIMSNIYGGGVAHYADDYSNANTYGIYLDANSSAITLLDLNISHIYGGSAYICNDNVICDGFPSITGHHAYGVQSYANNVTIKRAHISSIKPGDGGKMLSMCSAPGSAFGIVANGSINILDSISFFNFSLGQWAPTCCQHPGKTVQLAFSTNTTMQFVTLDTNITAFYYLAQPALCTTEQLIEANNRACYPPSACCVDCKLVTNRCNSSSCSDGFYCSGASTQCVPKPASYACHEEPELPSITSPGLDLHNNATDHTKRYPYLYPSSGTTNEDGDGVCGPQETCYTSPQDCLACKHNGWRWYKYDDAGEVTFTMQQSSAEIASRGTPTLSSTYGGHVASYINDGNFQTFAHTSSSGAWELNFGKIYPIRTIKLWSRPDCCYSYMGGTVTVYDEDGGVVATFPVTHPETTLTVKSQVFDPVIYGSKIKLVGSSHVVLGEIQVYAENPLEVFLCEYKEVFVSFLRVPQTESKLFRITTPVVDALAGYVFYINNVAMYSDSTTQDALSSEFEIELSGGEHTLTLELHCETIGMTKFELHWKVDNVWQPVPVYFSKTKDDCWENCDGIICVKKCEKKECTHLQPALLVSDRNEVANDTIGKLLKNQIMPPLPGVEHFAHGVDIFTGLEKIPQLFEYTYCSDPASVEILQNAYRGTWYQIPYQVIADEYSVCRYNMETTSYASSKDISTEMSSKTDVGVSLEAEAGGFWGFSAALGASFSQEKSVSAASAIHAEGSSSLNMIQLKCFSSKLQQKLTSIRFQKRFVDLINTGQGNVNNLISIMEEYGTHYYKWATMGGKLVMAFSTAKGLTSTKSSYESEEAIKASAHASLSGIVASGSIEGSYNEDTAAKEDAQKEFEKQTAKTSVLTYGGAAGSFGGAGDSTAPGNWGDWTQTVDLLPVPVEYKLARIKDIIANDRRIKLKDTTAFANLWTEAENQYYEKYVNSMPGIEAPVLFNTYLMHVSAPHAYCDKIRLQLTAANGAQTGYIISSQKDGLYTSHKDFLAVSHNCRDYIFSVKDLESDLLYLTLASEQEDPSFYVSPSQAYVVDVNRASVYEVEAINFNHPGGLILSLAKPVGAGYIIVICTITTTISSTSMLDFVLYGKQARSSITKNGYSFSTAQPTTMYLEFPWEVESPIAFGIEYVPYYGNSRAQVGKNETLVLKISSLLVWEDYHVYRTEPPMYTPNNVEVKVSNFPGHSLFYPLVPLNE